MQILSCSLCAATVWEIFKPASTEFSKHAQSVPFVIIACGVLHQMSYELLDRHVLTSQSFKVVDVVLVCYWQNTIAKYYDESNSNDVLVNS